MNNLPLLYAIVYSICFIIAWTFFSKNPYLRLLFPFYIYADKVGYMIMLDGFKNMLIEVRLYVTIALTLIFLVIFILHNNSFLRSLEKSTIVITNSTTSLNSIEIKSGETFHIANNSYTTYTIPQFTNQCPIKILGYQETFDCTIQEKGKTEVLLIHYNDQAQITKTLQTTVTIQ